MSLHVFVNALHTFRRAIIGWMLGIGAFVLVNVATYPAVKGQSEYDDILQDMPDALLAAFGIERELSLTSPEGYLISQVFGFLLPMLFAVLAIWAGTRAIAGEEEDGTLELLLTQPISRRQVALEKFGALVALMAGVAFATWCVLAASAPLVGLDAGLRAMGVATLASALFGIQAGALALGLGAALARRGTALAISSAVVVASFVVESLAELTDVVARVRWLSPFHFANGNLPMVHGLRALDVAVLLGLIVLAAVAGIARFERRDVGV